MGTWLTSFETYHNNHKLPQASDMVIIVNFMVHFAGGPYGKFMENTVSFITNILKLMEANIRFH